jgi:hypothetical protein
VKDVTVFHNGKLIFECNLGRGEFTQFRAGCTSTVHDQAVVLHRDVWRSMNGEEIAAEQVPKQLRALVLLLK